LRISAVRDGGLDLKQVKYVEGATQEQIEKFALNPGDLLLTRYNGSRHLVGIPALVPPHEGPLLHPDKLIRVVAKRELADPRFLNYQLQGASARRYLEPRIRTTAGQSGVAGADVRGIPLALPPLDEQRWIVDILEDHLSRLDAAERLLTEGERRLISLRRSALEREFASSGQRVPLAQLVERVDAGKSFGSANAPAAPDEWGIIKVSAMTWGEFRAYENKAVSGNAIDPGNEIHEGDLLVSRANTSEYVGASVLVGRVRPKLLLSDKSMRITPRSGVSREWLWRALQAPATRRQITAMATGTKDSMRNISQKSLLQVTVPVADEASQDLAVERFGSLDRGIVQLENELTRARRRHVALRRSLMSAAFSGQLTGHASGWERVEALAAT